MVPYALCIVQQYYFEFHKDAPTTTYIEYYQLVLCEVSRLYVKKCLRKLPEKIKFV